MPIIIIEGIDGGGKSTLAQLIKELSPVPTTILHRGPMKGSVMDEYVTPLLEADPDNLLIADRWHLSEVIYGLVYRGMSEVNATTLVAIEGLLTEKNATRVVVAPPIEEIRTRLKDRGEDFLQEEHIELVYTFYQTAIGGLLYHQVTASDENQARRILALAGYTL